MDNPIVFLDVDGTLLPFRTRPAEPAPPRAGRPAPAGDAQGNPLLERLDPADGPKLLALGCQLVWATTWMSDANDLIAPRLGLSQLPIVDFPDTDRRWIQTHHPGKALLHRVDPSVGLADPDFNHIREWLAKP